MSLELARDCPSPIDPSLQASPDELRSDFTRLAFSPSAYTSPLYEKTIREEYRKLLQRTLPSVEGSSRTINMVLDEKTMFETQRIFSEHTPFWCKVPLHQWLKSVGWAPIQSINKTGFIAYHQKANKLYWAFFDSHNTAEELWKETEEFVDTYFDNIDHVLILGYQDGCAIARDFALFLVNELEFPLSFLTIRFFWPTSQVWTKDLGNDLCTMHGLHANVAHISEEGKEDPDNDPTLTLLMYRKFYHALLQEVPPEAIMPYCPPNPSELMHTVEEGDWEVVEDEKFEML